MSAKDIKGPRTDQKIASMIQSKQTWKPEKQMGALSSTGSTGFQTHSLHPRQQISNTPPMPSHSTDNSMRRDHKQNQKEDLNGKQAYEQFSVAKFQLQKERRDQDEDYIKQLRAHIDRLETENGSLKHDLKVTESEPTDARNLSQIRAKELQGAQAFLDKADVLSTTDIVEKVNILNNEISQTASLLIDLLPNAQSLHWTQRQPTEMTNWMLGEKLARDLHGLSINPRAMNSRCREAKHWRFIFRIAITK